MKNQLDSLRTFARENKIVLLCILLFYLVWKTFYTCLENNFVNYDDQEYVYNNPNVKAGLTLQSFLWSFTSSTCANWHPITMLSHILDWQIFGETPGGHHLLNVILHCFNSVLLFLLLKNTTGAVWKSFAVAILFGVHPLRVESVAWVSERKDVLSAFFWMLAAIAYVRYCHQSETNALKARKHYAFALLYLLLGLMSKPMAVTFPCVLLLLDFWPLERWKKQNFFSLVKEKVPFFLLAGIFSIVTALAQTRALYSWKALPLIPRLENMAISYCRYLGKMFYPTDLAVFYPYPVHWPTTRVILSVLLLAAICCIVAVLRRKRPYVLMGWLWFLGTLVPVIGLIQVGRQSMADRYTYIPLIGIFIVVIWGAADVARRWRIEPVAIALLAVLTLMCSTVTRLQISYWKDGETLFRHALAVTENNYVAYSLIGAYDLEKTNYPAAIINFEKSLDIRSDDVRTRIELGIALARFGQAEAAIKNLQTAVSLETTNAVAHKELALALLSRGRQEEALTNLLYAIKLQPDYPEAYEELRKLNRSLVIDEVPLK